MGGGRERRSVAPPGFCFYGAAETDVKELWLLLKRAGALHEPSKLKCGQAAGAPKRAKTRASSQRAQKGKWPLAKDSARPRPRNKRPARLKGKVARDSACSQATGHSAHCAPPKFGDYKLACFSIGAGRSIIVGFKAKRM